MDKLTEITLTELDTDRAKAFFELAKRFCSFIENDKVSEENAEEVCLMLANMYCKAKELPLPDGTETICNDDIVVQVDALRGGPFIAKVEKYDSYALALDPYELDDHIGIYIISGDLSEIYADIKEGVLYYEAGYISNAIWEWRWGVDYHWGLHCLEVLVPLHYLYQGMGQEIFKDM